MLDRRPATLDVVDVDVAHRRAARWPSTDDDRDAASRHGARQRVVAVQRNEQRAVDVAGRQVALGPALLQRGLRHEEDKLQFAGGEGRTDSAEETRKEGVFEQPAGGLRDDEPDSTGSCG